MVEKIKSQQFQKILAIVLILFLLVIIPLTLSALKTPTVTTNHAAFQVPGQQHYSCGPSLTLLLTPLPESPDCSGNSGYVHGLTSFQSGVVLKAQTGSVGAYTVHWMWVQFWCATEDPHAPCYDNMTTRTDQTSDERGITGNGHQYVTAMSSVKSPANGYSACGYYQNDFGFAVYNNDNPNQMLCGETLDANSIAHSTNNNASWCHSGVVCSAVTPTSTPTPTPTQGVTPTPTLTPTPGPSTTPTPGPTATPTIGVTVTPGPTLPPTGPGNTLLGVGLAGIVSAIVGTAAFLAL